MNKISKPRNFYAKYDCILNKAKTFKDTKKESKKGYSKHKVDYKSDFSDGFLNLSF